MEGRIIWALSNQYMATWIYVNKHTKLTSSKRVCVKNNRVTYYVITRDKTEYSSHALTEVVDGKTLMSENWSLDKILVSDDFN